MQSNCYPFKKIVISEIKEDLIQEFQFEDEW